MPRFLYSVFSYLLLPLVLLHLLWRAWRAPAYRHRIAERFGFFNAPAQTHGLWIHAVSVGESIAAGPIIEHFLDHHPELPVLVTTMTPTGSERVRAMFGERVFHVYAPYDLPDAVSRFLDRVQPRVAVIMETEVWPNMVCQTAARGIPVLLANARLSAHSAHEYGRVAKLPQTVFSTFSKVIAQSTEDGARFLALGVPEEKLVISGSIKFDVAVPPALREQANALREQWFGARPVWIAASTHAGEDEILLAAHKILRQQQPDALLLLVPRHPERFAKVAELIVAEGFSFQRRSDYQQGLGAADVQVILGDTMGELLLLLGCADIAFVGGSLVERGGHNTLEPAAWGLPVLTGPSDYNFSEISALLHNAGALLQLSSAEEVASALHSLMTDSKRAQQQGAAAKQVVDNNRGALQRLLSCIEQALQQS
jgi:3-deoxy-D-manno-octulosonic-acid transferase